MTITFTDGSLTISTSEQTLWDITGNYHYGVWVFLHNMATGDQFTIKLYSKDQNAATMRIYDTIV